MRTSFIKHPFWGHCVKQKRFNVDNIFDMKGIGSGGIRFQQKIGFTLRIKKNCWKASISGAFCFRKNSFQCWEHACHRMHSFRGDSLYKKAVSSVMKGIQLGALWFSQNGLQCWDHVCHKRHPSSIFGALVFHAKKCFNVEDVFTVGGWGPVDFHKNGPPYGNHMQDQLSKLWIFHFTFQSTRLFSNETTEIPALAPCKTEVTLMIYVDCKSWNMSEWWPHSKARARPRDHVWRLINALGCNSTNLMRFSSLCPTSRAIPLRLLPKEQ